MIIKNKDSNQKIIDGLKKLLSTNIIPQKNCFSSKELKSLQTGSQGEENAAYYINFFYGDSPRWAVIHDLRIEHNGKIAQIDHILINRVFDFYILESKSFSDRLQINNKGEFSANYGNKKIGIESPLEQNERHIHLFNQFLLDKKILPKRLGVTIKPNYLNYVLISPKTTIKRPVQSKFDTSHVIKADTLRTVIENNAANSSLSEIGRIATLSSSDTIFNMAEAIVSFHKRQKIDLKKKYGLTNKHITDHIKRINGITKSSDITNNDLPHCPYCKSKMVVRTSKAGNNFWGCSTFPRCKGTRSIE